MRVHEFAKKSHAKPQRDAKEGFGNLSANFDCALMMKIWMIESKGTQSFLCLLAPNSLS